jgi:hypothetical protein
VIGTVTIWIVVPSENDVALSKDAVVCKGYKAEKETLGILAGKGCNGG